METYYRINGNDVAGILPKESKRYDSLDKAIKILKRLLNYAGVDDKYISCFDSVDKRAEKDVVIYKDDEDGDSLVFDYRYWITKETVQPVYIVLDNNKDINCIFPTEDQANWYLDRLAYDSGHGWAVDDRKGRPRLQLFGTGGVVLASYWVKRYEVEINE